MENTETQTLTISFEVPAILHRQIKSKTAREGSKIKFVGTELFKHWVKNGLPE